MFVAVLFVKNKTLETLKFLEMINCTNQIYMVQQYLAIKNNIVEVCVLM